MKQSIGLIILQFLGIAIGLVNTFWVAGSIPAELYAIVGVQAVISSIVRVFSNTGLETYAIRNVLDWKETGRESQITTVVTQAITLRVFAAILLMVPVFIYSYFVALYKYNGQYFGLFIIMGFMAIFTALNDATVLILRSFNRYLTAAFVTYSVNVFGRFAALLLFLKFGFSMYIHTIILLPLLITIPVLFLIKKWISFPGVFSWKVLKDNLSISRPFAASAYISYLFNFFDQLAVSIMMPAEILGAFTIGKRLLGIAIQFIENIFDPMIQKLVVYKTQSEILLYKLKRIYKVRNFLMIIGIIALVPLYLYIDTIIAFFRLEHYPHLNWFILGIYFGSLSLIIIKVKYNYIALFFKSKYYLILTVINALLSIVAFFIIAAFNVKFIFFYKMLTNLLMLTIIAYIHKNYDSKPIIRG